MSTPMPPNEPLDASEREFARIVRALPGGEPPPALDAAILRAATNAVAAQRRPGARLLASAGAMWGIGSAAAAVLALGVVWQMRYGSPDRAAAESAAPAAQMVSDREEDEAVAVDFGALRADAPASAPPPAEVASAQPSASLQRAPERAPPAPASPPPPPPAVAAAPEPYPADHLDEHAAREAINPVDASSLESTTVLTEEQKARADSRERDNYAAKAAAAPPAAAASASADMAAGRAEAGANALGGLAAPRQQAAPMKPATWLEEIRRLRDAGRLDEARVRLVEFRREYPKWVIPTDLAPLLSE